MTSTPTGASTMGLPSAGGDGAGTVTHREPATNAFPGAVACGHWRATIDGIYRWETEVALHDDWIEIREPAGLAGASRGARNALRRLPVRTPEPGIPACEPSSRSSIPGGRRSPAATTTSSRSRSWVDVWTDEAGVTVSSDDLPLVDYGGINQEQFHRLSRSRLGGARLPGWRPCTTRRRNPDRRGAGRRGCTSVRDPAAWRADSTRWQHTGSAKNKHPRWSRAPCRPVIRASGGSRRRAWSTWRARRSSSAA